MSSLLAHIYVSSRLTQNLGRTKLELDRIGAGIDDLNLGRTKLELDRIGAGIDDLRKEVEGRAME
jgi:hypothetical protein